DQATAGIRDDQLHAFETTLFEVAQEAAPALQILFLAFSDSQDLPETIGADPDRHQHADVAHLAGPATFEHHAVEVDVGEFPFDRAVAPRLDMPIDLLVQPAHGARAHPCAPQCFRDV